MTSPQHAPPSAPPGPGVRPPFAAAPVEGRTARVWLGLGVAGGVLALCCGAGIVSFGGVLITGVEALNEQAQRAVGDYLDAEAEGEWQEAYELRCAQDREEETLREFTDRVSDLPRIESYELGDAEITGGGQIRLPAQLEYEDGQRDELVVPLEQDPQTGMLEVCGLDR